MVYKFESEFSDRLREKGNVIHYMDQSVPKTKNMPFVREDTILPGSEIIEKLVPVALLQKTEHRTGNNHLKICSQPADQCTAWAVECIIH